MKIRKKMRTNKVRRKRTRKKTGEIKKIKIRRTDPGEK